MGPACFRHGSWFLHQSLALSLLISDLQARNTSRKLSQTKRSGICSPIDIPTQHSLSEAWKVFELQVMTNLLVINCEINSVVHTGINEMTKKKKWIEKWEHVTCNKGRILLPILFYRHTHTHMHSQEYVSPKKAYPWTKAHEKMLKNTNY